MDEARNYFIKEIDQNELMNNKHKKVYTNLLYIEKFFYFSLCGYCMYFNLCFCLLLGIPLTSTSSAIGLTIYAITATIKRY